MKQKKNLNKNNFVAAENIKLAMEIVCRQKNSYIHEAEIQQESWFDSINLY